MNMQEQNKRLCRRWAEEFLNTGNANVGQELCAKDYRIYFPGMKDPVDFQQSKSGLELMRAGFPDLKFGITQMTAEDDRVTVLSFMKGTHKGEYMGVAPTGKQFKVDVLVQLRCKDGKIAEERSYFDRLDMLDQLGIKPSQLKEPAMV